MNGVHPYPNQDPYGPQGQAAYGQPGPPPYGQQGPPPQGPPPQGPPPQGPPPQGPWRPPLPPRSDGSGMRKVGKVMTVVGAIVAVVSIAAAIAGFFAIKAIVERGMAESVEVRFYTVVDLDEGESRWLEGPRSRRGESACSVVDPDGDPVLIDWLSEYSNTPPRGSDDLGVFSASMDGQHVVMCSGPGTYSMGPGPDFLTVVIMSLVLGGVVLGVLAGPGAVVLGVIFWLIGRSQGKR